MCPWVWYFFDLKARLFSAFTRCYNTPMKRTLTFLSGGRVIRWVLVALVLLVMADGLLTNLLIHGDIAHEWNPFLVLLAGRGALLAVKVIGVVVCALLLWDINKHWRLLEFMSSYEFCSSAPSLSSGTCASISAHVP